MKPTIQELDEAISILEEELRLIPFGTEFDWSTGSEESEKQYIQTKLQALKFARAMMEPSYEILYAKHEEVYAEDLETTLYSNVEAATEQAWEEVVIAERLAKKENGITVEELERRLEE